MVQTDKDCIASCLDGHPEAFRFLVRRYESALRSYLTGRSGEYEWAEEIAQETFVRAYFALGKLKKPDSFFSWLLGIANRVAVEQQRQRQRQSALARVLSERAAVPQSSNDLTLRQAVGRLPEIYREVVLLRYYGRQSCTQVAEQLGIPLGTVTKRLSRAYSMLRESLSREDQDANRSEVRS